ncbi:hypothetical protein BKH41_07820 [Helicobacter sp. 12S02232-10]|uniref:heme-binding protein n=1 Tax=Helicobacter sp. 12S02232-10 TaxID=1476197 RepID=UPI000BA5F43A|nr:heme-binding protein [Helicobacter sp. 12S02232-10]PAF47179.1 hypothetical protein BKH41_07820 [Helicobacter sp. 12S02232-10]
MKKLLLTFVLGALGILSILEASDSVYAGIVKPLYSTQNSQKVIGKLLPTSEVKIIKKSGNKVLLSFQGYIQKGIPNAIYFTMGQRILVAGLIKNADVPFKILKTQAAKESQTGDSKISLSHLKPKTGKDAQTLYQKISVELWSDDGGFSSDLKSLYSKADSLYSQNCSICHALHQPTEFKANQWPAVIRSMSSRTGLNKDEIYLVTQYLQKHASDTQIKELK